MSKKFPAHVKVVTFKQELYIITMHTVEESVAVCTQKNGPWVFLVPGNLDFFVARCKSPLYLAASACKVCGGVVLMRDHYVVTVTRIELSWSLTIFSIEYVSNDKIRPIQSQYY